MKIGIAGSAGTGKSTLSIALAEKLGIDYIPSKTITHAILERDNYNYAFGLQIERFLAIPDRQNEIVDRMSEFQDSDDDFVMDKTLIDVAAYSICELGTIDPNACSEIIDRCKQYFDTYDYVFVCPWESIILSDNKKRTLNPYYQLTVYGAILAILESCNMQYHIIKSDDTEDRIKEIMEIVSVEQD